MKIPRPGSCRCETVRYEADIELTQGTSKCNCAARMDTTTIGKIRRRKHDIGS